MQTLSTGQAHRGECGIELCRRCRIQPHDQYPIRLFSVISSQDPLLSAQVRKVSPPRTAAAGKLSGFLWSDSGDAAAQNARLEATIWPTMKNDVPIVQWLVFAWTNGLAERTSPYFASDTEGKFFHSQWKRRST